jgi:glycine/D-amino acid oxidase-like deaminating enzyme
LTVTSRRPLWRDLLDDREVAALDPGVPDRLPRTPDVLVVGGGMVGVATAVSCRRAGLGTVALLEGATLGAGATAGAGGLLVPEAHHDGDPGGVVDLGRASLALWRELDDLVPSGVGLVDLDWLGLDPQPGLSAHLPPGAEVLRAAEVGRLVPELASPVGGVLVRGQARLNPLAALARLAGGVDHVATGVGVTAVATSGGRVVRVSTSAGSMSPGTVVFATGGPPELDELAMSVPASLVKGHTIATEPVPLRLGVAVPPMVTQVDEGRLLAGGTLDHQDNSPDIDEAVVANIRGDLEAAFPAVRGVPISHAWCCFRPAHPDELPVVDRVPQLTNAWMTSGHFRTGILMAPVTGRVLARWIDSGERPEEVRALELARFG